MKFKKTNGEEKAEEQISCFDCDIMLLTRVPK